MAARAEMGPRSTALPLGGSGTAASTCSKYLSRTCGAGGAGVGRGRGVVVGGGYPSHLVHGGLGVLAAGMLRRSETLAHTHALGQMALRLGLPRLRKRLGAKAAAEVLPHCHPVGLLVRLNGCTSLRPQVELANGAGAEP